MIKLRVEQLLRLDSGADITALGGVSDFDFSASSGVFKTPTGAATLGGSAAFAVGKSLTIGAAETIGTAQTPLLTIQNTTAATSGNQKYSPVVEWIAHGFETSGNTSQETKMGFQLQPVEGASMVGNLFLLGSVNGSAYSAVAAFSTSGQVNFKQSATTYLTFDQSGSDASIVAASNLAVTGSGSLSLGTSSATSVGIGSSSVTTTINGPLSMASAKGISSAGGAANFDWSSSSGTFSTSTDTNTFNGAISVASAKSITSAGGAANFDWSASSGTFATSTGAATLNGSASFAVSKTLTIGAAESIGTAQTAMLTLTNSTAATSGNQKYSPLIALEGRGWKTNSGGSSIAVLAGLQLRPVQGAANPTSDLVIWNSTAGGSYTELFKICNYSVTTQAVGASGDYSIVSPTGYSATFGAGAMGMICTTDNVFRFAFGASNYVNISTVSIQPGSDELISCGQSNLRWSSTWSALYCTIIGSALTVSSNTIAPTRAVHHVGAGLIKTITVPLSGTFRGSITLIPDAAFTWDATGNIASGTGTAIVGKTLTVTYDGTSWYFSDQGVA